MSSATPQAPLATTTLGTGNEAVVLLHGFLGSAKNLRTLAQRWEERRPGRHRFLLADLRGHGDSPPLDDQSSLDVMAADVLSAATLSGLADPFTICGHSLGGRVALAAAEQAPARVRQVVLLDITPGPIDPTRSESRRVLDILVRAPEEAPDRRTMRGFLVGEGLSPGLSDWLLMNLAGTPGAYRWRFDRQALDRLHDRFSRADLWDVVEQGEVPVWAIRGERSSYLPAADIERLQAAGVRVDTLAAAGHHVHVDALPELVELLATEI